MMASYVLCWLWSNKILYIFHVPDRCTLAFVTSWLTTSSLSFVWDYPTSSEVSQLVIDIENGAVSNINSFCKYTRTRSSVIHPFFEIILKVYTQCYVPNQRFYVPIRCEGQAMTKLGSHSLVVQLQPTLTVVLHTNMDFLYLKNEIF